ncbi:MAG: hypothetical protein SOT13_05960 [Candidatus Aphodousia sp.]|nr:hypothetical protein [Candidatus Aphodousia sp.]
MSTYQVQTFKIIPAMGSVQVQRLRYVQWFDTIECTIFQGTRLARAFCFVGPVTHWR